MSSEVEILEVILFIPTAKAAVLPEIMNHIKAIDDLVLLDNMYDGDDSPFGYSEKALLSERSELLGEGNGK